MKYHDASLTGCQIDDPEGSRCLPGSTAGLVLNDAARQGVSLNSLVTAMLAGGLGRGEVRDSTKQAR